MLPLVLGLLTPLRLAAFLNLATADALLSFRDLDLDLDLRERRDLDRDLNFLAISNVLEFLFHPVSPYEVPYIILLAANAYYLMRKMDNMNHWTYIRETSPELCTIHSSRLFPDDKVFTHIMKFLHDKVILEKDAKTKYSELLNHMTFFVATKAGILHSYVSKLLTEEKTPSQEGYKNLLEGILSIRLGCVINSGDIVNMKLNFEQLAIDH